MDLSAFDAENERLDRLMDKKKALLQEQAEVAREFNNWLTAKGEDNANEDGAIENSKKATKNLEAAIVQARNPGYFEYHKRSRKVREMEKKGVLKKLAARICQLNEQIEQATAQIEEIYEGRKRAMEMHQPPPVSGLKDWFARYGKPSESLMQVQGLKSDFVTNPKVYGGTSHHKAFRTLSVTLKRGRLTR